MNGTGSGGVGFALDLRVILIAFVVIAGLAFTSWAVFRN
jgi:hypothetical protein